MSLLFVGLDAVKWRTGGAGLVHDASSLAERSSSGLQSSDGHDKGSWYLYMLLKKRDLSINVGIKLYIFFNAPVTAQTPPSNQQHCVAFSITVFPLVVCQARDMSGTGVSE